MKLRLAMPEHLIDLRAIDALKHIKVSKDAVQIGAMTTQAELVQSEELHKAAPIIRETALQIADPQVRYVGTIGGNVANGDPGNDMPALMQCLDATFVLQGPSGERQVKAREFYEAAYFTARDDLEILTEISFPVATGGYAYEKQKRKIGDYATAAAAVLLTKSGDGCSYASIALTNLAYTPVYCQAASDLLVTSPVATMLAAMAKSFAFSVVAAARESEQESGFSYQNYSDIPVGHNHRYIVVATQGSGDIEALQAAVELDARQVSFVGSPKKTKHLKEKLIATGSDSALVNAIKGPAGIDIGGVTPQEIALSILAEIISLHRKNRQMMYCSPVPDKGHTRQRITR